MKRLCKVVAHDGPVASPPTTKAMLEKHVLLTEELQDNWMHKKPNSKSQAVQPTKLLLPLHSIHKT